MSGTAKSWDAVFRQPARLLGWIAFAAGGLASVVFLWLAGGDLKLTRFALASYTVPALAGVVLIWWSSTARHLGLPSAKGLSLVRRILDLLGIILQALGLVLACMLAANLIYYGTAHAETVPGELVFLWALLTYLGVTIRWLARRQANRPEEDGERAHQRIGAVRAIFGMVMALFALFAGSCGMMLLIEGDFLRELMVVAGPLSFVPAAVCGFLAWWAFCAKPLRPLSVIAFGAGGISLLFGTAWLLFFGFSQLYPDAPVFREEEFPLLIILPITVGSCLLFFASYWERRGEQPMATLPSETKDE